MPASPYHTTVHPPINDLASHSTSLDTLKSSWANDASSQDGDLACKALDNGTHPLQYCEFLEVKLEVKVGLLFARELDGLATFTKDVC